MFKYSFLFYISSFVFCNFLSKEELILEEIDYVRPVDVFRDKEVFLALEDASKILDENENDKILEEKIKDCIYSKSLIFSNLKKDKKDYLFYSCLNLIPEAKKISLNLEASKLKIVLNKTYENFVTDKETLDYIYRQSFSFNENIDLRNIKNNRDFVKKLIENKSEFYKIENYLKNIFSQRNFIKKY